MMPASMEASIAAAPRDGPTRRSEIALSSSGRAPPSMSAARSLASAEVKLPVMSVEPPRMPTLQPTPVLTSGEEMISPSRTIAIRRLGSPDGLQAALPVMSAQVLPPLPAKSIATTHSTLCSRCTALAPPISSPWMTVGPTSSVSPWSDGRTRLSFLLGSASGSAVVSTSWIVSLAVVPILLLGLLGLGVAGDARELDEDPVVALARQGRLGDTEGVDATAEDLEGLVDVLGVGRRLLRSLRLEDELRAPAEVETEVGLDVDRQRRARGQQAENEDEADPDTT